MRCRCPEVSSPHWRFLMPGHSDSTRATRFLRPVGPASSTRCSNAESVSSFHPSGIGRMRRRSTSVRRHSQLCPAASADCVGVRRGCTSKMDHNLSRGSRTSRSAGISVGSMVPHAASRRHPFRSSSLACSSARRRSLVVLCDRRRHTLRTPLCTRRSAMADDPGDAEETATIPVTTAASASSTPRVVVLSPGHPRALAVPDGVRRVDSPWGVR